MTRLTDEGRREQGLFWLLRSELFGSDFNSFSAPVGGVTNMDDGNIPGPTTQTLVLPILLPWTA
ncbi:hypothetical protein RchiOBHm_Chr6g0293471 [Rosa chinensis]|uniref:Uncharacterized protein n=1 Tax=Rosa chinensis TaxID=74649 RepID=A0A2P6PWM3_ROSCH|nr:hypothetical protein RchiOBHm_Chr6g0293471 [Rosa chinensis]